MLDSLSDVTQVCTTVRSLVQRRFDELPQLEVLTNLKTIFDAEELVKALAVFRWDLTAFKVKKEGRIEWDLRGQEEFRHFFRYCMLKVKY